MGPLLFRMFFTVGSRREGSKERAEHSYLSSIWLETYRMTDSPLHVYGSVCKDV